MEKRKTKLSLGGHHQLNLINGVLFIKDLAVKHIVDKYGTPTFFFHSDLIKSAIEKIDRIFVRAFSLENRLDHRRIGNTSCSANYVNRIQKPKDTDFLNSQESSESRKSVESQEFCEKENNSNKNDENDSERGQLVNLSIKPRGFYSVKSNYLEPVIKMINEMNFGFEIITELELNLLIKNRIDPERILCGGPYFPLSLMEKAINYGIDEYVLYDLDDLIKINDIANRANTRIKVILRFVQNKYEARVGIPAIDTEFDRLSDIIQKAKSIKIIGILNHYASQMNSIEVYQKNAEFLVDIANKLRDKCGIRCSVFDIGGGFPEAFIFPDTHFLKYLEEMRNIFIKNNWADVNIYYEPGRYIVGSAGFLFSKIVRRNNHYSTLFLDVGTNLIPIFARSSIRLHNVDKIACEQKKKFDIMGSIPSDQDLLAKNYNFEADSDVNDRVIISGVGAYTLTFSNRFPYAFPAIIFYENGEFHEYRSRGDSRDIALN